MSKERQRRSLISLIAVEIAVVALLIYDPAQRTIGLAILGGAAVVAAAIRYYFF